MSAWFLHNKGFASLTPASSCLAFPSFLQETQPHLSGVCGTIRVQAQLSPSVHGWKGHTGVHSPVRPSEQPF